MAKGKVLVLGSNATRIEVRNGGTGATGQYLNETVVPAQALIAAGYDVVLATPNGKKPHIDEASRSAQHFEGDEAAFQRAEAFYARFVDESGAHVALGDRGRAGQLRGGVRPWRTGANGRSHARR